MKNGELFFIAIDLVKNPTTIQKAYPFETNRHHQGIVNMNERLGANLDP